MTEFRFSPIRDKGKFFEAIHYIAENTTSMCEKIIRQRLPISSLTVFSHYPDEFEKLKDILMSLGKQIGYNNGPYVRLEAPMQLPMNRLMKVRVRHPDPERPQVGCNDFQVQDYASFKNQYLGSHPNHLRLVVRPEYEMIEFFHPDFDVLAYVVSEEIV